MILSSFGGSNPSFHSRSSLPNLTVIEYHYHIPRLTLDIFLFPVAAQDIFLCPTTHGDSAESIHRIPTMGSSPSFFLHSLTVQNSHPGPKPISPTYGLTTRLSPDPVTITQSNIHFFGRSIYPRPDLAHTHTLTSAAPTTLKLTHSPGRQGKYIM